MRERGRVREGQDLGHALGLHPRAVDLDLVRVHGRVGHQDLGILDPLGLPHADLLVQNEALGVREREDVCVSECVCVCVCNRESVCLISIERVCVRVCV